MCAGCMVGIARDLIAPTGCKPGKSGGFHPLRVKMELGCTVQFGVGRKQGFQVLHQNRIADAAAADIKMMNHRSSLFGRVKNGLCGIKDQCTYHIFRLFITFQMALKPA